jgi:hypothetical protein
MSFTGFGSELSSTLMGVPPGALPSTFVPPNCDYACSHLTYCVLTMFASRVVSCNTTLCPILLLKPFKTLVINTPLLEKCTGKFKRESGQYKLDVKNSPSQQLIACNRLAVTRGVMSQRGESREVVRPITTAWLKMKNA